MISDRLIGKRVLRGRSLGARYTGTISEYANTVTGGWRPEEEKPATVGSTDDALMIRME